MDPRDGDTQSWNPCRVYGAGEPGSTRVTWEFKTPRRVERSPGKELCAVGPGFVSWRQVTLLPRRLGKEGRGFLTGYLVPHILFVELVPEDRPTSG